MKKQKRLNGRRPKRRRAPRHRDEIRLLVGLAPRKPSPLEIQGKKLLLRLLEQAEKDPERVINGIGKLSDLATETLRLVKEQPEKARRVAGTAALSFLAGAARKKLEE
jgi:hypothetical protein